MNDRKLSKFGLELQLETSRLLRQGRRMRKFTIVQAAQKLELSPFFLKALEDGTVRQPVNIVARVMEFYGVNETSFVNLVNAIMLEKCIREWRAKERRHLSLVGDCPKPWESLPESLAQVGGVKDGKMENDWLTTN